MITLDELPQITAQVGNSWHDNCQENALQIWLLLKISKKKDFFLRKQQKANFAKSQVTKKNMEESTWVTKN